MKIRIMLATMVLAAMAMVLFMSSEQVTAVRAAACFARCTHPSHGANGWTGPQRMGANASAEARKDAEAHDTANPGHHAFVSCPEISTFRGGQGWRRDLHWAALSTWFSSWFRVIST
jgi:hypothetical protein